MNRDEFGRRMKQARKAKRMTSDVLARRLGLNPSYIRQIECGRKTPSLDAMIAICNEIDVSPNYLLRDDLQEEASTELGKIEVMLGRLSPNELAVFGRIAKALCES